MNKSALPPTDASGYVLALGAGRTQYPFIADALEFGADLIVVDMRFCPEIKKLAEHSAGRIILIKEDLKEPGRILDKLRGYHIRALLPVPVGRVFTTAGLIADKLGLCGAGFKAVDILTDKIKLHAFMRAHAADGLNCTRLYPPGQEPCYPCIAKQRFGSGSRGVAYIKDPGARAAFEHKMQKELQLKLEDCYFEQFLEGREFLLNLMLKDGRPVLSLMFEKELSPLPQRYETAYTTAISLTREQRQQCLAQVLRLCSALELKTCIMQVDIIFDDKSARPYIIDCSPRFTGNCIQDLIKTAFGLSISKAWLELISRRDAASAAIEAIPSPEPEQAYFMQLFSFEHPELRALTALPDLSSAPGLAAFHRIT